METICFEMAVYVSRTATTPILNQSNERNATILDAQGRLAALSVGIPQFMLTSTLPVRFALEFLGVDEFREGDVFVANDPYHGGGHLPDYNVFAPVFARRPGDGGAAHGAHREHPVPPRRHRRRRARRLQRHRQRHLGRGRALAGGEGRRPRRRAARRALRAADQQPHPDYIGDLRAQIGAAQLAVQRLGDVLDRYGASTVEESRRLHDRLRGAALPRGGHGVARRRVRGRRVRRPRPARQPRRPPPREDHRRRRHAHDRLHGLRHAPGAPGVVDVRQHARLHGRPDRLDDGPGDPEERGLLRPDQARRSPGLRAEPARRASR